ncbi:MAG: hypothetical protein CL946_00230 [Ectothiorhodospiraceae bacterium]|nr:hypothetical protein [Ectothiorhodospiraceae bacterium]
MKQSVFLIVIVFPFFFANAQFDAVVISDRLGESIEPYERAYFQLFPKLSGFREARAFRMNTGYYLLIAYRDNREEKRWVLTEEQWEAFSTVIQNYEEIRYTTNDYRSSYDRFYTKKYPINSIWKTGIFGGYLDYSLQDVQVRTKQGDEYYGKLLHVNSKHIVLGPLNHLYSDIPDISDLYIAETDDITFLSVDEPKPITSSALYGFLIGGVGGIATIAIIDPSAGAPNEDLRTYSISLAVGLVSGLAGAGIGAIIGAADDGLISVDTSDGDNSGEDEISRLRELMYYRYGLPPELYRYIYK